MNENNRKAIIDHIDKIEQYAKTDPWLMDELRRRFGGGNAISNIVADDVSFIRSALNIRANCSINYDFIDNQRLKDQLVIDNLRMENAALNLQEKEIDRFYTYCVNAFYQVENIINYYFHLSYPSIDALLDVLEESTKGDGKDGKYKFKRSSKEPEKNVGDIPIFYKINAFCNIIFPKDLEIRILLGNLRQVRNEGEHRCQVIYAEKDESNKLYKFLEQTTFNTIRIALIKLVTAIKTNIQKPIIIEATIANKLPSSCFISFGGKTVMLPNVFLKKVNNLENGDKIKVTVLNNKIISVEAI